MLRKAITYSNADGIEVTEDFFFHLTKAEVIKLQVTIPGGFAESLESIGKLDPKQGNNAARILQTFEDIVRASFGKKTEEGRFVKRLVDWEEFVATDAYSNLFMELITDGAYAAQFIKGILPADMDLSGIDDTVKQLESGVEDVELPPGDDSMPDWVRYRREPSMSEVVNMSKEEMILAFKAKSTGKFPGDE
jgi:hypothetical protein